MVTISRSFSRFSSGEHCLFKCFLSITSSAWLCLLFSGSCFLRSFHRTYGYINVMERYRKYLDKHVLFDMILTTVKNVRQSCNSFPFTLHLLVFHLSILTWSNVLSFILAWETKSLGVFAVNDLSWCQTVYQEFIKTITYGPYFF